jgi:hypothetical protein
MSTLVIIDCNVARNYKTNVYTVLVRTNEGKQPLGKPRGGQTSTTDFEETGLVSSPSGKVNMAGCCTNGDEPSDFTKCGEFVNSYRNC